MKVYITKYALSRGILVLDVREAMRSGYVMPTDRSFSSGISSIYKIGRDAFHTWEEAVQAADKLRTKKLKSLDKQREKIWRIVFKKPDSDSLDDGDQGDS